MTTGSETDRIKAGQAIGAWLAERAPEFFEVVPTAWTRAEKEALVARQRNERREGEVWIRRDCRYIGGKQNGVAPPIVRTKYTVSLPAVVLSLSPTKVKNRPFGSVEVGVHRQGQMFSLGSAGSGFSLAQMKDLKRRQEARPGNVVILVRTQGFTPNDQLRHGVFAGFSEGIDASACVWVPDWEWD